MRNHVPVIIVLISSIICAMSSSTSTKPPPATATSTTGAAPSKCSGVGQLGKQYTIVSARHYTGFVWVRPSDGLYVVTCNPGCSPIAGYRATKNDTHTTLTIDSLTMADVGTWGLLNATKVGAVVVRVCVLSAAGLPQCSISSDEDTDSLEPGAQLTLTVNITHYYCSRETGFDLTTGAVTDELVAKHNVTGVSTNIVNQTFNADVTRLGDVTLTFLCGKRWNLLCDGVKKLIKSPPHCDISSDTDTNTLVPGTNLTLTVDIKNYYCPQETGFNLTTGHVTDELRATHKVSHVSDLSVNKTFSVDIRRLGDVTLNFVCDRTWNLKCNGIQELFKSPPQCDVSSDTDTNTLVLGTNLTLTVDIKNYYCPQETGFNLTTGAVTEDLVAKHNVTGVSTNIVNKTFNVDVTRLGDVMINFQCTRSWTVTCNGVQKLFKRPPLCNISSDTDTNALHLGTNLTLMVDLRNYYCQYHAGFGITTGSITDVLLQNQTTKNITNTALTTSFNVTADHLGDVSVVFMCDGVNKTLECGGVGNLTEAAPTTTFSTSTSTLTPTSPETTSTSTSTLPTMSHTTSHTTSEEPSTTARSPSTGDTGLSSGLTVGLPVGLSLCVVLFIGIVAFKVYNERLTREKQNRYIVETKEHREVDLKGMTIMHEIENYETYVASTEAKNNNP